MKYLGLLQPAAILIIVSVALAAERMADTAAGMLTMFGLIALAWILAWLGDTNKKSAARRGANSANGK